MTKKQDQELVPWEDFEQWVSHNDAVPLTMKQARDEFDIGANHILLKELDGETFRIIGLRPINSSYEGQDKALFVECMALDGSEVWTTVIGAQQPMEFLRAYVGVGADAPLEVTLKWNTGGKYGGYWTIE